MSELTKQEQTDLNNCFYILGQDITKYQETIAHYKKEDSSFDYSFYLERIRIACSNGPKFYVKVHKEIVQEIRSKKLGPTSFPWARKDINPFIELGLPNIFDDDAAPPPDVDLDDLLPPE